MKFNVTSIRQLNDNELEGTIPVELGKLKLTKLFELNPANNKLEGLYSCKHQFLQCTEQIQCVWQ